MTADPANGMHRGWLVDRWGRSGRGDRVLVTVRRSAEPVSCWWFWHPLAPWLALGNHAGLVVRCVGREVRGRWQGTWLGPLWTLAWPLLALATYTVIFGSVLHRPWPAPGWTPGLELALTLLAGLTLFNACSEILQRSPGTIVGQPQFVKKVVFPIEILPAVTVLTALTHAMIGWGIVCCGMIWLGHGPGVGWLWLPVILVALAAWLLGLAWLLAAIGTFVRDVGPLVVAVCPLLLFLTPVFYPLSAVPERWRLALLVLNPLASAVECSRAAFRGEPPEPLPLVILVGMATGVIQLGFGCFMRARPAMADVV